MFKRLFRSRSAPRLPGREAPSSAPAADDPGATVTAYDQDGNPVEIPAAEWLKVLDHTLQGAWDDPDELYRQIMQAVDDGYAGHVAAASQRLLAIDPYAERAATVRSIVLMKTGNWDGAEGVLNEAMGKLGRTGILLTNLAKVYAEHGDTARADATLWEAIQADPNQDNGLGWWLALQRERGGDQGYLDGLDKTCALPGSWLPQLWKARARLDAHDPAGAESLFRAAFAADSIQPRMSTALVMASGALGQAGQLPLMIELVAPRYDIVRHHPHVGLNLLQAYVQTGDLRSARELLARMRPDPVATVIKDELDGFEARIAAAEAPR